MDENGNYYGVYVCGGGELFALRDVASETDPESPIRGHPDDCRIYYYFGYPMTCGEGFAFSNEKLVCVHEEEADCLN